VPFVRDQKKQLQAKLDKKHVSTRKQAGRSLSYIEGWHAIAEANRIFGFGNWTRETLRMECVYSDPPKCTYLAIVQIKVFDLNGEFIALRQGTGAGHGQMTKAGDNHESAAKEAETDAMKRALMTFGNVFGLALYDKTQANVGTPPEPEPEPMTQEAMDWAMDAMSKIKSTKTEDELTAVRAELREQFMAYQNDPQNAKAANEVKVVMQEHLTYLTTTARSPEPTE